MKVKTSITLSEDIIKYIDATSGIHNTRSEFIERALRDFIERRLQKERDSKDLAIYNKKAERLNKEADDTLSYQAEI